MTAAPGTDRGTDHGPSTSDRLFVVRQAVLSRAAADAQRVLGSAAADVAEQLAEAEERAAQVREAAATETTLEVAAIADEARARARRQERAILLAVQRSAFEQLRARARTAVRCLRDDPGYPALIARLTTGARDRLGPQAAVREHPDGGVQAETSGRRLSLTLDAAAVRAVDALGSDVEGLWQP